MAAASAVHKRVRLKDATSAQGIRSGAFGWWQSARRNRYIPRLLQRSSEPLLDKTNDHGIKPAAVKNVSRCWQLFCPHLMPNRAKKTEKYA